MADIQKLVDFSKCKDCIHYKLPEDDDVCNECLNTPAREDSHTPIKFKKEE